MFAEEDFLQLSGLQHFAFCRRQWALIHVENQWEENYRTVDGSLMHERVHDAGASRSRNGVLQRTAVRVFSPTLGVSGECDLLEFRESPAGISLPGEEGLWQPFPVEYKRGKPGTTEGNALQLCGQALCLEEMLCCRIPSGALYYGETRHRETVEFTEELRTQVKELLREMHEVYDRGYTPKVKPRKGCTACSLKEICLPKLQSKGNVAKYIEKAMQEP